MKAERDLLTTLRALRSRLVAQLFTRQLARALFAAAALLVLLAAIARGHPGLVWNWGTLLAAPILAALFAAIVVLQRRPSLLAAAEVVDRAAATRDRFTTALDFSTQSGESHRLALRECAAWVRGKDFAPHLPWRMPRELRWLWVPVFALALLFWDARVAASRRAALAESGAKAVAPALSELQKLAQEMQKRGDDARSEEMKRLAEEIRRSADRLRTDTQNGSDAGKSTLRELSALEEMVRQLQEQQRSQFTPEELQELAKALRENQATEEAGRQLDERQLAAVAESLEKKAVELSEKGDERTAEEIKKALEEALERLAQQQQLSPSARQTEQQSGPPSDTMKKLAEMLRKMPGQRGTSEGKPGQPMSPQALQKLLSQLENMKQGEGKAGQPGAANGSESQILMQAFDRKRSDDQPDGKSMVPTGQPGGEHDKGTTDSPFAEQANPATPKGADLALSGLQGKGETASQLLPGATSDDSKARRKYKDLYEAMAPAAEEAVQQENIPLGSRFFVKRYFEAIRPKE